MARPGRSEQVSEAEQRALVMNIPFGNTSALTKLDRIQAKIDIMSSTRLSKLFFSLCLVAISASTSAQSISRTEALRIAESYIAHRWQSTSKNVFHGKDARGIEVNTPDRNGGHGTPLAACWRVDSENVGVAYKWGGLDTPAAFDLGIRAGKAAGDVYTADKRRRDDAAVSDAAVGIDCSGFVCRCWKLRKQYSTRTFAEICRKLSSPTALEPADIMNHPAGHVLLFVKWLDPEKKRALFYESAPFSKTLACERDVSEMTGYLPMRYRHIHD